ncbi:hypothetical protein QOZ80_5AG0361370 [Eleusine coracana subsp. coracana]|nr:hypothetical protein QOZ80_5AG0361370 [Eleusine coracana subsp. coracana]
MPPPPPEADDSSGKVRVVEVWTHNQEAEQACIGALAGDFPVVAVAVTTSHDVSVIAGDVLDDNYQAVRASVERVRAAIWEWCAATPAGVLVTRDGAEDVAYVVRQLREKQGARLPARRDDFLRACNAAFPALYDLKVLAEYATVAGDAPPLAAAGRDAFARFLALLREHKDEVLVDYNAFLSGLGAADTIERLSFKKAMAEYDDSMRRMKELFVQLCPGQDPELLDRLPIS